MLVDQPRLVQHREPLGVALLEGDRLVDGEAELAGDHVDRAGQQVGLQRRGVLDGPDLDPLEGRAPALPVLVADQNQRSEEHTSELQSLMRISYAVFCLKKKKTTTTLHKTIISE